MTIKREEITVWLSIGFVILAWILWPSTSSWDGQGEVSMFPEGAEVKNYRLDADMTVTEHRSWYFIHRYDYLISQAYWPNGGYSEFDSCNVISDQGRGSCTDQDGNSYLIEVNSHPGKPEVDDSGDYGY